MKPEMFNDRAAGNVHYQPTGYWAFIPNPLPPVFNWTPVLIQSLSAADRALGQLAGLGSALPDPNLLIKPFVRREAVLSSRIEGTRASLADLYAYEAGQLKLFELPEDVREVENYVGALNYGLKRLNDFPMSLRFIRELHDELLRGVRGEQWTPGAFRRSQNWIGAPGSTLSTATFVPPPVEPMHTALRDLERFIHANDELPPLVRVAMIHYQFEAIHPFLDGNGRVGRLLINMLLYSWQLLPHPLLYISAYFNTHRQTYYDNLLAVSQQGKWEPWLLFFLDAVRSQADDSVQRIRRLLDLQDAYRTRMQTEYKAARLLQAVDKLFEYPVFTIQQMAERLDVNYSTAQRYVMQLEEQAFIREVTGQARNRVYSADAIVSAVSIR